MISIICPSFNTEGCIRSLIESVLAQTSRDYELIIVDGGSRDRTVEILDEYKEHLHYISERDAGIYDAMNKGIGLANGEWLYFIGADDSLFCPTVIEDVSQVLSKTDADVVLCRINVPGVGFRESDLTGRMVLKNTVNHQGALYHKKVFEHFRYDISYTISADYDLNFFVFREGLKVIKSDIVFANHSFEGASGRANFSGYREEMQIRRKYVNSFLVNSAGGVFSIARYLFRKIKLIIH